ncbi:unnamed protein product [Hymenolepis diminuta]|uniref:NAD(+) kinase n=1 Tax=Hymenolepis diminuta TaxID=6216 RepID=A0A0R3SRF8_HYMDI|nr:unnamed protein product [Hymenolepis diminuta]
MFNVLEAKFQSVICSQIKYSVQVNTVNCNKYDYEDTKAADLVISVGGDGTFLSAALRITDKNKPIIGINSNPDTSEGSLCLPRHWHNNIPLIVDRLMNGDFRHSYRQRIRLISSTPPSELKALDGVTPLIFEPHAPHSRHSYETTQSNAPFQPSTYLLPFRSLNDVFVSACMSARVSRYEVSIDDNEPMPQKSSGFLVCTGTGSSSWHRSLHQVDANLVARILSLASDSSVSSNDNNLSAASSYFELAALIAERYNSSLLFSPDSHYMAFSVRELIANHVFKFGSPRGFAKKLRIVSRMDDAYISVDGWLALPFEDGASLELSIHPGDVLCVADFSDDSTKSNNR